MSGLRSYALVWFRSCDCAHDVVCQGCGWSRARIHCAQVGSVAGCLSPLSSCAVLFSAVCLCLCAGGGIPSPLILPVGARGVSGGREAARAILQPFPFQLCTLLVRTLLHSPWVAWPTRGAPWVHLHLHAPLSHALWGAEAAARAPISSTSQCPIQYSATCLHPQRARHQPRVASAHLTLICRLACKHGGLLPPCGPCAAFARRLLKSLVSIFFPLSWLLFTFG